MALVGLDHINIRTDRLEETRRFFIDVLGLSEGARPDFPFGGAWLYLGDRAVVHLVERAAPMAASSTAALDHFALQAEGYEAMKQSLDAKGIAYRPAETPGTLIRQLFITDPNAVNIELNFAKG